MTAYEWNKRAQWFFRIIDLLNKLEKGHTVARVARQPWLELKPLPLGRKVRVLKPKLNQFMEAAGVKPDEKKLLHCPYHDDHNPSMLYQPEQANLHCFACHEPGITHDLFDLIAEIYGLDHFKDTMAKALELLTDKQLVAQQKSRPTKKPRSANPSGRIYLPILEDEDGLAFLKSRGINRDTAEWFNLLYWSFNSCKYLVIPCGYGNYVRRRYVPETSNYPKYWVPRNTQAALFNSQRLQAKDPVFVVESALDAIWLEQSGFPAVAINGVQNFRLLTAQQPPHSPLLLLLDNDPEGAAAGTRLVGELKAAGIACKFLYGNTLPEFLARFKDVGDAVMTNPQQTLQAVAELYARFKEQYTFGKV